ncbi:signal peptidase I [Vulgatibacter incomptus]|uniref:Signal peptidase I n=1 Tax=Vulgatibacter incomptus TaxID=1391653 RepID=A0A0K1PBW2_9BACT|nr:signal peptidase I [Vulgatibacter incomptus]AKU91028.1 Signal peptidase I [Vulgatibacter incomptus]
MSITKNEALAAATTAVGGAKPKKARKEQKGFFGLVRSVGPALAVALGIRAFLFEPFSIPSGSMLPTLQIGDYVVVSKFAYGVRIPFTNRMLFQAATPMRGDVIVFERPTVEPETLIKRVIGLPGETIAIVDGVLQVNGEAQPRDLLEKGYGFDDYDEHRRQWRGSSADLYVERLAEPDGSHRHFVMEQIRGLPSQGPWRVPEGHVLVLGDNRDNSADSRVFGFVPLGNIRGRADVVGFSWGKDGLRTDRIMRSLDAKVPEGA